MRMTSFQSRFLQDIKWRGYIADCTDFSGLDTLLKQCEDTGAPLAAYIGFDCTAPSLHVGSLIQIMMLKRLQQAGHKPIVLMGGATTKIGDPSGKDESRKLLTDEVIEQNKNSIREVFKHFLKFEDKYDPKTSNAFMVDNADWLSGLNYLEFLRDYGRHFSVNKMIARESVKIRLERESHLSFLEFNYMILQAYDFVKLAENHACRLQIGGSDQWGNIVGGIELHHHVHGAARGVLKSKDGKVKEVTPTIPEKNIYGLTTPLLTTASGGKMGKTEKGAVWLNAEQLSPYDYWQFWRNTEDADVGKFLRLFTDKPEAEIQKLESLKDAAINEAKIALANAATAMLHGEDEARKAEATAREVFEKGGVGGDLPTVEISKAELDAGIKAYALFHKAGLEESGGKSRKLIQGNGASVNDVKVSDPEQLITSADLKDGIIKLSAGKKRHTLIRVS